MTLRDQSGFTLMEVIVGATVMLVILGASLAAFSAFEDTTRVNQLQNDAQEEARSSMDQLARELRNHASATRELPIGIDKAERYDLVFQTIDSSKPVGSMNSRNLRRVRYCVDDPSDGTATLWAQSQTWTTAAPPAVPSTGSCPDGAWPNQRALAHDIANREGAQDRSVFCPEIPAVAGCSYDQARLEDITRMRITMFVDVNLGEKPSETRLESGVQLRNKNRPPEATFNHVLAARGHLLLNASDTFDPEGDRLVYVWFDGGAEIGRGIVFDYEVPTSGTHTIALEVSDVSGLVDRVEEDVTIP